MLLFIILQLLAIKRGNCCNRKLTRSQRQSAGRVTFGGDGLSTNHRKSRGVQVGEENYILPIIDPPSEQLPFLPFCTELSKRVLPPIDPDKVVGNVQTCGELNHYIARLGLNLFC